MDHDGVMAVPVPSVSRQLWILRHAKAADGQPGGRDRDRPLTARGRRDASALGVRLAADGAVLDTPGLCRPERALCSSAVRTTRTAELVLGRLATPVPLDSYRSLYQAEPETVLDYVRETDDGCGSVLVVGHNPTMFHLTWDLLDDTSLDRERLDAVGFPTCALAVVDLGVAAWADVATGQGALVGLFTPPY
jgi:phosphohistidine phosphatase